MNNFIQMKKQKKQKIQPKSVTTINYDRFTFDEVECKLKTQSTHRAQVRTSLCVSVCCFRCRAAYLWMPHTHTETHFQIDRCRIRALAHTHTQTPGTAKSSEKMKCLRLFDTRNVRLIYSTCTHLATPSNQYWHFSSPDCRRTPSGFITFRFDCHELAAAFRKPQRTPSTTCIGPHRIHSAHTHTHTGTGEANFSLELSYAQRRRK